MCFIDDKIYSSIKLDKNYIMTIDGEKTEFIDSKYFYSYAYKENNYLYLASFESGVDALYDLENNKFLKCIEHNKNNHPRSHYISRFKNHIVSVNNGTNQLFIYDEHLNVKREIDFDEINIRLLSFDDKYMYLNTEISNELIVLDENFKILKRIKLTEKSDTFSGGNASNHHYVVISLRGEDNLALIDKEKFEVIGLFKCGKMPRDLTFYKDYLLVTCTDDNSIERYKIKDNTLIFIDKVNVCKPITFSLGGKQ